MATPITPNERAAKAAVDAASAIVGKDAAVIVIVRDRNATSEGIIVHANTKDRRALLAILAEGTRAVADDSGRRIIVPS